MFKRKPPRLRNPFAVSDMPLYYVTANTRHRQPVLANTAVHEAFREYALQNAQEGRSVGRYVIMPDHLHFFVRGQRGFTLGTFVRLMKQSLDRVLGAPHEAESWWQPGFFDHVMRSDESYAQKWEYVRRNPVRKGLVAAAEEWPFQGEIVRIDRA